MTTKKTARKRKKSKPLDRRAVNLNRAVWVVDGDHGCTEAEVWEMPLGEALVRIDELSGAPRIYWSKALANRAKARRDAAILAYDLAMAAVWAAIEADDR